MKTVTIQQDNASKIKVTTTSAEIERTCKRVLGWRTPTKRYTSIHNRFMNTGSSNYDKVIAEIARQQEKIV